MTGEPPTVDARIVQIAADATVADARRALDLGGGNVALVCQRGRLIGLITRDELDAARNRDDQPVLDVITTELVHIDPATGDLETLDIYRHAAWASLRRRAPGRRRLAARRRQPHEAGS